MTCSASKEQKRGAGGATDRETQKNEALWLFWKNQRETMFSICFARHLYPSPKQINK